MDKLNSEQLNAATRILQNKENIFITGSAGVGKSYLLKTIVEEFRNTLQPEEIWVTALTGIAATNIDGITLHSYTGFGHDLSRTPNMDVVLRWKKTKILIIDEVSMLTKEFLKKIYEYVVRFGIQLVCFGDFFQLPPVDGKPCFISTFWKKLKLDKNTVELKTVVRQTDQEFINVLNEVRIGELSPESIKYLYKLDISNKFVDNHKSRMKSCDIMRAKISGDIVNSHLKPFLIYEDDDKNLTKLYSLNRDVNAENKQKLDKLPDEVVVNTGRDELTVNKRVSNIGNAKPFLIEKLNKESPKYIELKIGAKVMLTRNRADKILVNGSMGVIKRFEPYGAFTVPVIKFESFPEDITIFPIEHEVKYKNYKLTRLQLPLKLAWSLTVHRSQGLTLDNVLATLYGTFATGQVYTVLSRVKGPGGLTIDDVETLIHYNKVCPLAKKYYKLNT